MEDSLQAQDSQQNYQHPSLALWYRIDGFLQKFEGAVLTLGMVIILVVGTLDILLRNTIDLGLPFSDTVARQLTVWLGLVGASLATASADHISIDAFSHLLKGKGLKINRVVVGIFTTIGCGVLAYCTIVFVMFYINSPTYINIGPIKTPTWAWILIFPFSFCVMTLRNLMRTIEEFLKSADPIVMEEKPEAAPEVETDEEVVAASDDSKEGGE